MNCLFALTLVLCVFAQHALAHTQFFSFFFVCVMLLLVVISHCFVCVCVCAHVIDKTSQVFNFFVSSFSVPDGKTTSFSSSQCEQLFFRCSMRVRIYMCVYLFWNVHAHGRKSYDFLFHRIKLFFLFIRNGNESFSFSTGLLQCLLIDLKFTIWNRNSGFNFGKETQCPANS